MGRKQRSEFWSHLTNGEQNLEYERVCWIGYDVFEYMRTNHAVMWIVNTGTYSEGQLDLFGVWFGDLHYCLEGGMVSRKMWLDNSVGVE